MHLSPLLLPLLLAVPAHVAAKAKPRDAILLSQVESLTLRGDKQTSHRRVSAIPQLKCVSGRNLCDKYAIDVMRCENKGSGYDTEDIQWSCTAQLPDEFKLGSTDVICEGYSSPDDPYVLKGSCGVEYRLVLTAEGEEKWPNLGGGGGSSSREDGAPVDAWTVLFWVIFACVVIFILYNICNAEDNPGAVAGRRHNGGGGGGGYGGGYGGGGGNDDWSDPPPPYSGRRTGAKKSNWSGLGGGSSGGGGWQSNLASGAAGAAAGYYAGSRGRNNNSSSNTGNYGSSWGGGGGGSSRSGSSGSSGGSAASSSRHESTGFGSTSRR